MQDEISYAIEKMQDEMSYAIEKEIPACQGTELSTLQQFKLQLTDIFYGLRQMGNNPTLSFHSKTCCTDKCANISWAAFVSR